MSTSRPRWERFYPPGARADFVPQPGTLNELFADIITRHADRVAIDYRDRELTYRQLGAHAARVANALRLRGIGRGRTVALYLPNGPLHPVFFFAVLLTGARVTHLSPLDAYRELAFKCADSEAALVVTLSSLALVSNAARLVREGQVKEAVVCDEMELFGEQPMSTGELPAGCVALSDFIAGAEPQLAIEPVSPADVALLQYTGGTTGLPKAAMLTHGNLSAAVDIYEYWFATDAIIGHTCVTLVVLPLFHIYALTSLMLKRLKDGARLVLHQRFEAKAVIEAIERKRIVSLSGVPTMWIAMAAYPGIETRDLSSLRGIASGGAPLPVEVQQRVEKLFGLQLRGGWGMTETSPVGTNLPLGMPRSKVGSVGVPMPGVLIEIVAADDPRRVLAPGEIGEIRVKGPIVTAGYWKQPQETVAAFVDSYFLTGDIGRMDEDGFVYIVDRKKDLILSGGFNVYPRVIEDAIFEHPAVAEVMVIGVADAYRGEAAKAFVVLRAGFEPFALEALRLFLAERVGKHEMPRHLEFRSELPKTAVGKYSRKTLRDEELGLAT